MPQPLNLWQENDLDDVKSEFDRFISNYGITSDRPVPALVWFRLAHLANIIEGANKQKEQSK